MSGGQDWASELPTGIDTPCPCQRLRDAEQRYNELHDAAHAMMKTIAKLREQLDRREEDWRDE